MQEGTSLTILGCLAIAVASHAVRTFVLGIHLLAMTPAGQWISKQCLGLAGLQVAIKLTSRRKCCHAQSHAYCLCSAKQ